MNMYGDSIMFWGSGVCIKPAIRATGSRNDATANALQARLRVRVRELDSAIHTPTAAQPTRKPVRLICHSDSQSCTTRNAPTLKVNMNAAGSENKIPLRLLRVKLGFITSGALLYGPPHPIGRRRRTSSSVRKIAIVFLLPVPFNSPKVVFVLARLPSLSPVQRHPAVRKPLQLGLPSPESRPGRRLKDTESTLQKTLGKICQLQVSKCQTSIPQALMLPMLPKELLE